MHILPKGAESETVFTQGQLARAFDRVRDLRDWKGPVRAEIEAADREITEVAVVWFTATVPVFDPLAGRPDRLVISAPGYRMGPWGIGSDPDQDLPRPAVERRTAGPAAIGD